MPLAEISEQRFALLQQQDDRHQAADVPSWKRDDIGWQGILSSWLLKRMTDWAPQQAAMSLDLQQPLLLSVIGYRHDLYV